MTTKSGVRLLNLSQFIMQSIDFSEIKVNCIMDEFYYE